MTDNMDVPDLLEMRRVLARDRLAQVWDHFVFVAKTLNPDHVYDLGAELGHGGTDEDDEAAAGVLFALFGGLAESEADFVQELSRCLEDPTQIANCHSVQQHMSLPAQIAWHKIVARAEARFLVAGGPDVTRDET